MSAAEIPVPSFEPDPRSLIEVRAIASMRDRRDELSYAHAAAVNRTTGLASVDGYEHWQRRERALSAALRFCPMPAAVGLLRVELLDSDDDDVIEIGIFENEREGAGIEWGGAIVKYALEDERDEDPRLLSIQWCQESPGRLEYGECSLVGAYADLELKCLDLAREQQDKYVHALDESSWERED